MRRIGILRVLPVALALLLLVRRELMSGVNTDRMAIWQNLVGMVFGFLNAALICTGVFGEERPMGKEMELYEQWGFVEASGRRHGTSRLELIRTSTRSRIHAASG